MENAGTTCAAAGQQRAAAAAAREWTEHDEQLGTTTDFGRPIRAQEATDRYRSSNIRSMNDLIMQNWPWSEFE
jgi:hypothetical protein